MLFWKDVEIGGEMQKILHVSEGDEGEYVFPNITYWRNKIDEPWLFNVLMQIKDKNADPTLFNTIESEYDRLCNERSKYLRVIYAEMETIYPGEIQTVTMIVKKDFKTGEFEYLFESSQDGLVINTVTKEYLESLIAQRPELRGKSSLEKLSKVVHSLAFSNSNMVVNEDIEEEFYKYQSINAIDVLDYYVMFDNGEPVLGVGAILNFDIEDTEGSPKFIHDYSAHILNPLPTILLTSNA